MYDDIYGSAIILLLATSFVSLLLSPFSFSVANLEMSLFFAKGSCYVLPAATR